MKQYQRLEGSVKPVTGLRSDNKYYVAASHTCERSLKDHTAEQIAQTNSYVLGLPFADLQMVHSLFNRLTPKAV